MQKKIKLTRNDEKIYIEVVVKGKINYYYELRLHERDLGKIKTFEGDNFYDNDDTHVMPDDAKANIERTILFDIMFNSKRIPPLEDEIANFELKFFQGKDTIDTLSFSEKLNGDKQSKIAFIKFTEA